jgi:hypothetical protein
MARPHADELPAHMAVLGLVVERPNQTVAYYATELAERFPHARFGKPTAYTALRQMAKGKDPRVRLTRSGPGAERALDLYEPVPLGLEAFRSWMFRPPIAIPAVRHAIYGRIELARLEDLPQLISIVREEEDIATDLYADASGALRKHEIKQKGTDDGAKTRADFEREIRETWLYVGPLHWSGRSTLCSVILERLEEIALEAGIAIPERKRGAERDQELRERRAS